MPEAAAPARHAYGPHPSQYAELWLPETRRHRVIAVVIHGGFWRQAYGAELGRPLAADLAARGIVSWNLEYRRTAGGEGGYPQTFEDVAAGIDALDAALADAGIPDGPRIGIGHSAGGHLAYWAAGRTGLPTGAPGAMPPHGRCLDAVVSQAGVLDLHLAHELGLSADAAGELMGPRATARDWGWADPAARTLPRAPLAMLHGRADEDVPVALARSFAARARAAGAPVDYREFDGDHYGLVTPGDPAWEATVAALLELASGLGA